jgi:hypothetical protein
MVLRREPLNLHQVCEEIRGLLAPTIAQGVGLVIDVSPSLWVLGDRLRWKQVVRAHT